MAISSVVRCNFRPVRTELRIFLRSVSAGRAIATDDVRALTVLIQDLVPLVGLAAEIYWKGRASDDHDVSSRHADLNPLDGHSGIDCAAVGARHVGLVEAGTGRHAANSFCMQFLLSPA